MSQCQMLPALLLAVFSLYEMIKGSELQTRKKMIKIEEIKTPPNTLLIPTQSD